MQSLSPLTSTSNFNQWVPPELQWHHQTPNDFCSESYDELDDNARSRHVKYESEEDLSAAGRSEYGDVTIMIPLANFSSYCNSGATGRHPSRRGLMSRFLDFPLDIMREVGVVHPFHTRYAASS